jgi:hypothetical protein
LLYFFPFWYVVPKKYGNPALLFSLLPQNDLKDKTLFGCKRPDDIGTKNRPHLYFVDGQGDRMSL